MVNKKPEPEVLSREHLLQLGKLIEKEEFRALYHFLVLCGPRITEALRADKQDFTWQYSQKHNKNIFLVTLKTLKRADKQNRVIPVRVFQDDIEERLFKFVYDWVQTVPEGRVFDVDRRRAWEVFRHYITLEDVTTLLERPLKEIQNAQIRQATTLRFYPHYLRACRVTHLSSGPYRNRPDLTQKYFGWRNILMLDRYTKRTWEELVV